MLPGQNARMSCTRSSNFPVEQAGACIGRYFAAVLRTEMSVSGILPGKTAVPKECLNKAIPGRKQEPTRCYKWCTPRVCLWEDPHCACARQISDV